MPSFHFRQPTNSEGYYYVMDLDSIGFDCFQKTEKYNAQGLIRRNLRLMVKSDFLFYSENLHTPELVSMF